MAIASMLASMADWWTPTVLFCVLNLMIAIIFIASNYNSPSHHHHHHHDNIPSQLARSPSLLERVKSVNLSSFYTTPESDHQYKVHSETTEHDSASQLSPPPSLLQRVKSIDFSFSSFHMNSFLTESGQLSNSQTEGTRSRTRSLVDRVKSFKLTSPHHDSIEDNNITSESRSVKKVATSDDGEENNDKRRPLAKKNTARVHDESVDAKADDYIKRFKQQLKLQRLNSLQSLREMLNRGT